MNQLLSFDLVTILGALIIIYVVLFIRNIIVYGYYQNALELIHKKALDAINGGDDNWIRFYDKYEEQFETQSKMVLDVSRWTFDQFFPGIKNLK